MDMLIFYTHIWENWTNKLRLNPVISDFSISVESSLSADLLEPALSVKLHWICRQRREVLLAASFSVKVLVFYFFFLFTLLCRFFFSSSRPLLSKIWLILFYFPSSFRTEEAFWRVGKTSSIPAAHACVFFFNVFFVTITVNTRFTTLQHSEWTCRLLHNNLM